ncbi:MAG: DUF433 domain-containing protein [Anaerolineae bacterium]
MVTQTPIVQIPLHLDLDGVIRVGKSRLTLDLVLDEFKNGASPEAIAWAYPAVTLVEVYAAVTYYLQNQSEVEEYLRQSEEIAESNRRQWDHANPVGLREKLLARLTGA